MLLIKPLEAKFYLELKKKQLYWVGFDQTFTMRLQLNLSEG